MRDEVERYIEEQVSKYTVKTYDLLNEIKILVFDNLQEGVSIEECEKQIEELLETYESKTVDKLEKDYSAIGNLLVAMFIKNETSSKTTITKVKPNENQLKGLTFKLDYTSTKKATERYQRVIKDFYKTTSNTLKKEYVDKEAYLTKKVSQYDKVEKVVPYHYKNGQVRAYFDIAGYNSMVYNTNLTSSAWNETLKYCGETGNNLVYVPAHPYSCPLCQPWQGRVFALTDTTPIYPNINEALAGGLKHPNCKHPIMPYNGQKEDDKYSTAEWEEKYQAKQKKQSLELKRSRLKTDAKIYKELGNMEEVDKIKQKVSKLNKKIKEQKELMG